MIVAGYFAGKLMGFSFISSLFLGGMLSMSSTTIIMKALDDLNMRHRRFAPQVLAVLIVEDLIAVILMVLLSSIAINNSVSGEEALMERHEVVVLPDFMVCGRRLCHTFVPVAPTPVSFRRALCWCFASGCAS